MKAGGSRRVAVYGEVDPNLVDGSSVWLLSICQVLASIGDVAVTLLLRRPLQPERRFLLAELEANGRVDVVDAGRPALLGPGEALDRLEELDRERGPYDVVLLRGQAVLTEAAERPGFDGRLWSYAMTGRGMGKETLRALASRSARLLCQTEAAAEELRAIVPGADGSLLVLPPMIPDTGPPPARDGAGGTLCLAYSGKLAPEYCWLETVDAFRALRELEPTAELHVLGDKIHRPSSDPGFHEEALRALGETEGLRWHGAVSRSAVHGLLAECDLALSIRDPGVEAARELSTKVLEYGAAGLPVVLNRAPAYERLLGRDYPLFVDGPEDAVGLLTGLALDPEARAAAAAAGYAASREFTFARVAAKLSRHLPASAQPTLTPPERGQTPMRSPNGNAAAPCVLIAGHDLKFVDPIREAIASTGATIIEDVWHNHTEHDEAASLAALEQADVIFCEWCLGNAAWYSRNKRPGQRLVVRMHRMELETSYPGQVNLEAVDSMVFVSQHVLEEAVDRFGWAIGRLQVIPNSIDCGRLLRPKSPDARFNLALIGYVPMLKRLDRALDILEELRRQESRFRMAVVGRPPSDFKWVVSQGEEVAAFRYVYARVHDSDLLRGAVEFLPYTTDLPTLFEEVGWILSTSDVEGHQVTLAEGAASGAVPVILDRPGVREQYQSRWVHSTVEAAAASVAALASREWSAEQIVAADHAANWSSHAILPRWTEVLSLGDGTVVSVGIPKCDRVLADADR